MTDHLLPPSASSLERSQSIGTGVRYEGVPIPHRTLWDPYAVPAGLLPWLAWTVGADEWDPAWDEDLKRRVVADAITLHRYKGTPWAIKAALERIGFTNVEILEFTNLRYDAAYSYDGTIDYGGDIGPYEFDVVLNVIPGLVESGGLFGGTPSDPGTGELTGGTAADPGTGEIFGGTPEGSAEYINVAALITEAMLDQVRARIETYKNERSKLRTLWTYQQFYDSTLSYDGLEPYDGGMA